MIIIHKPSELVESKTTLKNIILYYFLAILLIKIVPNVALKSVSINVSKICFRLTCWLLGLVKCGWK
jgi:hypothetical protein